MAPPPYLREHPVAYCVTASLAAAMFAAAASGEPLIGLAVLPAAGFGTLFMVQLAREGAAEPSEVDLERKRRAILSAAFLAVSGMATVTTFSASQSWVLTAAALVVAWAAAGLLVVAARARARSEAQSPRFGHVELADTAAFHLVEEAASILGRAGFELRSTTSNEFILRLAPTSWRSPNGESVRITLEPMAGGWTRVSFCSQSNEPEYDFGKNQAIVRELKGILEAIDATDIVQ